MSVRAESRTVFTFDFNNLSTALEETTKNIKLWSLVKLLP